jgi:ABC-type glycerol-3-phosphate transport system substrate-binding protein
MARSKRLSLSAMALVAVALAACSGAAAGGPGPTPVAAPTVAPSAAVEPSATIEPADGGGDAMPISVDLQNATGDDVHVDIVDRGGHIVRATSGTPGDGATVAPYTIEVTQVDDRTVALTWSDIPGDNALALHVDETGTGLILVQPEHDGDSMGLDRILVLEFDAPVSASDLQVSIQQGVDTPG